MAAGVAVHVRERVVGNTLIGPMGRAERAKMMMLVATSTKLPCAPEPVIFIRSRLYYLQHKG